MTELSDSTALCNQLNFHESEDDNNNNNVNDIFIGNLSQNSTPEDTPMNNSLNIQNDIKNEEANDDDDNVNVEYNDTIDEYIKTTKKKTSQTKTNINTNTNATSIKKPKASSTSIKKNAAIIKQSSTSLKKNNNSITKTKPKSIKASHSTVTTASRSSNFIKNLPQSKTTFKNNNNNNNTSSKKLNVKVKATSSTAVKPKASKSTINSNNNVNKHKRTKSEVTNINKEGTITSHSNNTITKKDDVIPLNMSLHLPTTEQAQTNICDENNGLTQLIFSKDESNDVSTVSAQRVPARKRTRRDSYKHSIMVVQEKLLKKEEEKGESNKISFNDNEHQIRRKRSALGDFKDIDENATKPPPKLRKSSRKFTALRSSTKVVNKQNQNEDINTNDNNNNNNINDNITNNGNEDDKKGNFEFEHSPIIEEKHDYGSTERKMKHNEMNDKFMKLFNEIKNKIQTEKEKTKQQQLKLKKSSSTPLINTKNKSLIYTTKANDNITTKRQLLSDLLKQNTRNNNSNTDRNINNNNENLKRSAELKTKFKLLKRNDINNNTNTHNHHNKVNSFTNSALLLQLKHEYNKKYLLDNGVVSLSAENENEKEGEGTYKTFEELKSKTLRNGLDLNKLSINKSLGIFELHNENDNNNKKSNKNKSSKVRNVHYKGLSLSQLLLSSFMDENGNCDLNAKVCPPNAMEKSKFNYFVE